MTRCDALTLCYSAQQTCEHVYERKRGGDKRMKQLPRKAPQTMYLCDVCVSVMCVSVVCDEGG